MRDDERATREDPRTTKSVVHTIRFCPLAVPPTLSRDVYRQAGEER